MVVDDVVHSVCISISSCGDLAVGVCDEINLAVGVIGCGEINLVAGEVR